MRNGILGVGLGLLGDSIRVPRGGILRPFPLVLEIFDSVAQLEKHVCHLMEGVVERPDELSVR
jgi:hypothetical protein